MTNLSQNDRNIITEHPLDRCLDHLQDALRKAKQDYISRSISHDSTVNNLNTSSQKAISRLLYILQGQKVALDLRSKIENSNIATNYQNFSPSFKATVIITNSIVRCHALSSKKPLMSIFEAPSSILSLQSFRQSLSQAFLPPSMALPSRSHLHPFKAANKLERSSSQSCSMR